MKDGKFLDKLCDSSLWNYLKITERGDMGMV